MNAIGLRETLWLVVDEPAPRWTPAIKAMLARNRDTGAGTPADITFRVLTTRERLTPEQLAEMPAPTLALIEISEARLTDALSWIARVRRASGVGVIALLDPTLGKIAAGAAFAFAEAGAILTLRSTLEVATIRPLAQRFVEQAVARRDVTVTAHDRAWRRLPWQPVPAPLR